jgi:hypothetical protein
VVGVLVAEAASGAARARPEADFLLIAFDAEAERFKLDVDVSESEKVTCGDDVEADRGFKPDFSRCFAVCRECWIVRILNDASELEGDEFPEASAFVPDSRGSAMGSMTG